MLGWFREASTWASRRKRINRLGSCAKFGDRTLIATSRLRFLSRARYTSPIPPAPTGARISYEPSTAPVSSAPLSIAGCFRKQLSPFSCVAISDSTSFRSDCSAQACSRTAGRSTGSVVDPGFRACLKHHRVRLDPLLAVAAERFRDPGLIGEPLRRAWRPDGFSHDPPECGASVVQQHQKNEHGSAIGVASHGGDAGKPRAPVLRSEACGRGVPAKGSGERCGVTHHKPGKSALRELFERAPPSRGAIRLPVRPPLGTSFDSHWAFLQGLRDGSTPVK